ncbi:MULTISPECIES: hypothetical protein [unclassified Mycoplasma]|uniref:hypothetical protein n=1 Tax=unclassified Mycoplasma TaxID=2683645 RepID=UPI00216B569A|nr:MULTISPECIES: hypothetical protein [unclassified Mycoplasma]MCS4536960.1 hypothetical protein [Mycoplasma sp. CSL7475-4]MCT4469490.1 hypothetical protein [Mycoplasma sp. HS2188]
MKTLKISTVISWLITVGLVIGIIVVINYYQNLYAGVNESGEAQKEAYKMLSAGSNYFGYTLLSLIVVFTIISSVLSNIWYKNKDRKLSHDINRDVTEVSKLFDFSKSKF